MNEKVKVKTFIEVVSRLPINTFEFSNFGGGKTVCGLGGLEGEQLRSERDFANVTLASEDADIEVHKLIFASVSPFFF